MKSQETIQNSGTQQTKKEIRVSWKAPPVGWVKLNTDKASKGNPGLASVGGILQYFVGNWLGGFARPIGECLSVMVELWVVLVGSDMA